MLLGRGLFQGDLTVQGRVVLLRDGWDAATTQDVLVARMLRGCSLRIGITTFNLVLIKESFIDIISRQLLLPPVHYLLIMSGQGRLIVVKYDILEYLLLFLHPVAEHPALTGLFLTLLSGASTRRIVVADLSRVDQVRFHCMG